jgi:tetratricopeptide (TPR) repeat protein
LNDCDQLQRLLPDDPDVGELRTHFLHHLGRHAEAVAEWRSILRRSGGQPATIEQQQLNGFAYATAIGALDLAEGRLAAENALQIVANVPAILDPGGVLDFGRAVTAHKLNQSSEAVQFATAARDSAVGVLRQASHRVAHTEEADPKAAVRRNEEQALRAHLAGILEFRARLHDELGQADEAEKDRLQKQGLTSGGNLAEVRPYGLEVALVRVENCANVLDTRGFVLYRLGFCQEAMDDLDCALAAFEQINRTLPAFIDARKHLIIDMRQESRYEDQVRKTLAVIRYHRSLVLDALGEGLAADKDRAKIRELGFVPDDHLF